MKTYLNIVLLWNLCVLALYGADKLFSMSGRRRIPEKTLLCATFLFGGAGALFGMFLFNHKTRKTKFRVFTALSLLIMIISVSLLSARG